MCFVRDLRKVPDVVPERLGFIIVVMVTGEIPSLFNLTSGGHFERVYDTLNSRFRSDTKLLCYRFVCAASTAGTDRGCVSFVIFAKFQML